MPHPSSSSLLLHVVAVDPLAAPWPLPLLRADHRGENFEPSPLPKSSIPPAASMNHIEAPHPNFWLIWSKVASSSILFLFYLLFSGHHFRNALSGTCSSEAAETRRWLKYPNAVLASCSWRWNHLAQQGAFNNATRTTWRVHWILPSSWFTWMV